MLQLRPSCEQCNKALPPHATEAMICTYECTFCSDCVDLLENVCPNCGGGFCLRPQRPSKNLKNENYLTKHPASTETVYKPTDLVQHKIFAQSIKPIHPHKR